MEKQRHLNIQSPDWMVGSRMRFVPQNSTSTTPFSNLSPIVEDSDSSSGNEDSSPTDVKPSTDLCTSFTSSESDNDSPPTDRPGRIEYENTERRDEALSTTNRIRRRNRLPRLDTSPQKDFSSNPFDEEEVERPKYLGKRVTVSRKREYTENEIRSFEKKSSDSNGREKRKKREFRHGRRGKTRSKKYIFSDERGMSEQEERIDFEEPRIRRSERERRERDRRRRRRRRRRREHEESRRREGQDRKRRVHIPPNHNEDRQRKKERRRTGPRMPYQQLKIDEKTKRCLSPTRSKLISSEGRKIISRFELSTAFVPPSPCASVQASPRSPTACVSPPITPNKMRKGRGRGGDGNEGIYENSLNQESYFTEMKNRIIKKHRQQTEQDQRRRNRVSDDGNSNKNSGFFNYQNYLNSQNVNLEVRRFAIESNEDFTNFLHQRRSNRNNNNETPSGEDNNNNNNCHTKYFLSREETGGGGGAEDCESVYSLNTWVPTTPTRGKRKKKKKKKKEGVLTKLFRSTKKSRKRRKKKEEEEDIFLKSPQPNLHHQHQHQHHYPQHQRLDKVYTSPPNSNTPKKRSRFRFPKLFSGGGNSNNNNEQNTSSSTTMTTTTTRTTHHHHHQHHHQHHLPSASSTYPNVNTTPSNKLGRSLHSKATPRMFCDYHKGGAPSGRKKLKQLRPITCNVSDLRKQSGLHSSKYSKHSSSKKNLQDSVLPFIRKIF